MTTNITAAVRILDEFLLKGELPVDVLQEALQAVALSPFSKHLTLAGLEQWKVKPISRECLLHLRILFQDEPTPSDQLLSDTPQA